MEEWASLIRLAHNLLQPQQNALIAKTAGVDLWGTARVLLLGPLRL
jgi:hypothetical protein